MDDVPFQPSWLLHAGGMPVARQPDLDVEAFVASFECAVGALRHAERSPASDERQAAPVVALLKGRPLGDDVISFTDFLASALRRLQCQDGLCHAAFRILDRDADGYIDAKELGSILRRDGGQAEAPPEVLSAMLAEASGGGPVSYKDFVRFIHAAAKEA
ncbi:unnamed protein product [Effrenium voratum]|nr:unnamed protein product [Effrenium voratum]CAJ1434651.1 unnamed protein product [Effrenium voratum]